MAEELSIRLIDSGGTPGAPRAPGAPIGQSATPTGLARTTVVQPAQAPDQAMLKAIEQMQAEQFRRNVEAARLRIDPALRASQQESRQAAVQAQNQAQRQQLGAQVGQAAQMATAAGGINLGRGGAMAMAGGQAMTFGSGAAAALGPVGIAVGAAMLLKEGLESAGRAVRDFAVDVASFDADKMLKGLIGIGEKIPGLPGMFASLGQSVLSVSDAINATAQRLSQYDGTLAAGLAQIEVRKLMRDIDRAQKFGPEIMRSVEARDRIEQAIERLQDRLMPLLARALPPALAFLEANVKALEAILAAVQFTGNVAESGKQALPILLGPVGLALSQILKTMQRQEESQDLGDGINDIVARVNQAVVAPWRVQELQDAIDAFKQAAGGQVAPNFPGV